VRAATAIAARTNGNAHAADGESVDLLGGQLGDERCYELMQVPVPDRFRRYGCMGDGDKIGIGTAVVGGSLAVAAS